MANVLPQGWTAHQDPQGRWFYAHAPSGTTQWVPPPPQQQQYNPHQGYYANSTPAMHTQQQAPSQKAYASQPGGTHYMSQHAAKHVYSIPVEFKLKEKAFSLSGDSFSVKRTDTGAEAFKVKGNALSFRDSKQLLDPNGQSIYKMTEALLTVRGRMHITDSASKQPVITLRKKGFIPGFGTSTIQAWRGGTDDGTPYMEVKGDFLRKDFTIKEVATGRVLATVKRKSLTLTNILLEKDTYVIRVEPGQDAALMVFFVVAADEQYRDDGNRRGYSSFL